MYSKDLRRTVEKSIVVTKILKKLTTTPIILKKIQEQVVNSRDINDVLSDANLIHSQITCASCATTPLWNMQFAQDYLAKCNSHKRTERTHISRIIKITKTLLQMEGGLAPSLTSASFTPWTFYQDLID